MKISVRVKTNARKNEVKMTDDGSLVVSVTVSPIEGKANEKIVELIAAHFGKPKRLVSIIRGHTGKTKLIEIL